MTALDLHDLGLDEGATVLLTRALAPLSEGATLTVRGAHPGLEPQLRAWARSRGDSVRATPEGLVLVVGAATADRWRHAHRAGGPGDPAEEALDAWGLSPRGALVEEGVSGFAFRWKARDVLWADELPRLYAQAAAAQWDPNTAIDWSQPLAHDEALEDALAQVLTYLIENETAALLVPARLASQTHPHYRETLQLLAIQCADEARHIEVFTRRLHLRRGAGTSSVGGNASLRTLLTADDFDEATFLLSVLGEGSFLSLLWFLHEHAPDGVTREVMRRAAQDEARHVAFALAHLGHHAARDPSLRARLAAALGRRHDALRDTAGLNADVFDALVVLGGGGVAPEQVRAGHQRVLDLVKAMDDGRRQRLRRLGFADEEASALSRLHTRNFM